MATILHIPADDIHRWRLEQLEAAGYPEYEAFLLSRSSDVDLHQALALARTGCPLETALRILL